MIDTHFTQLLVRKVSFDLCVECCHGGKHLHAANLRTLSEHVGILFFDLRDLLQKLISRVLALNDELVFSEDGHKAAIREGETTVAVEITANCLRDDLLRQAAEGGAKCDTMREQATIEQLDVLIKDHGQQQEREGREGKRRKERGPRIAE
jgi:hypothetical protein